MEIKKVYATKGDYTLLRTKDNFMPYVVAWKFNGRDWCQGHYFPTLFSAQCFFNDKGIDLAW